MTTHITRRAALSAGVGMGAVALVGCGEDRAKPVSAFAGLLDDFARELIEDSPELATRIGAIGAGSRAAERLDDRSADAVQFRRNAILRRLVAIKGIDRATLGDAEKVSYDVVTAQLDAMRAGAQFTVGRFAPLAGFSPYVVNHLDCAALTLPDFLDGQHAIATVADADSYVTRLAQVAGAIDAETARLRADASAGIVPPAALADRALTALAGFFAFAPEQTLFVTSLRSRLEALVGAIGPVPTAAQRHAADLIADAIKLVAGDITFAYRRAFAAMQDMRARAVTDLGIWRAPEGAAYYAAALANETGATLSPDEIHEIGLQRVKELTAETDVALRALGAMQGSVGARLAALAADPRFLYPDTDDGRAQVLVDMRAAQSRIEDRMAGWFAARPKAPLAYQPVRATAPPGQPVAYYQPPRAAPAGKAGAPQPGTVFVDKRALGSIVKFDLTTLAAHEGVPGHHLQMAATQEAKDLPLLRRLIASSGFIEGWGVYAEQLADEMGVYEGDAFGRLGYLRWRLWRAARLVVDTGIHAKRWTREQAIAYLIETTGDAPGAIAVEVDRYAVWPGQACAYELGALRITEAREKARADMGGRFDIKAFHALLLSGGAIPLSVLDGIVGAWSTGRAA